MTLQVYKPQKSGGDGLQKLIGLGQVVGGSITGNPAMIVSGAGSLSGNQALQTGGAALGMAGVDGSSKTASPNSEFKFDKPELKYNNPLQRRMELTSPSIETISTFREAEKLLPSLPQEVRSEIAPALFQSMARIGQTIKSNPQYMNRIMQDPYMQTLMQEES